MKRHADTEPWAYSAPEQKSRNSVKGVLTRMLLGIGLGHIVLGLWNLPKILKQATPLQNAHTLTGSDFQASGSYDLGESVILDSFAAGGTDNEVTTNYYAAAFRGKDNEPMVITLAVNTEDDIHEVLMDYLSDDTQQMGDLSFASICGVAQPFDSDDLESYYQAFTEQLLQQGFSLSTVPLELIYKGTDPDSFQQRIQDEHDSLISTSLVFVVLGLVFLAIGLLLKYRAKKQAYTDDDGPRMNGPEIL